MLAHGEFSRQLAVVAIDEVVGHKSDRAPPQFLAYARCKVVSLGPIGRNGGGIPPALKRGVSYCSYASPLTFLHRQIVDGLLTLRCTTAGASSSALVETVDMLTRTTGFPFHLPLVHRDLRRVCENTIEYSCFVCSSVAWSM